MMKKMAITIISIMYFFCLQAPPNGAGVIFVEEGICPYEPLIKAVVSVESNNGRYLFNPDENAVGHFQIRQIRVDDYNRKRGTNYKLTDFYDYDLSRQMFLYYCKGREFEQVAKSWNGSGEMTKDYWRKIQKHL